MTIRDEDVEAMTVAEDRRPPIVHELKTWASYFHAVFDGRKNFEIRRDDRGFRVGDILWLRETNYGDGTYTGRDVRRTINYILRREDDLGLADGFAVLSLEPLTAAQERGLTGRDAGLERAAALEPSVFSAAASSGNAGQQGPCVSPVRPQGSPPDGFKPGWLREDVERANARIAQWQRDPPTPASRDVVEALIDQYKLDPVAPNVRSALQAALSVAEGWQLVPKEPNEEMEFAGNQVASKNILDKAASFNADLARDVFAAMLLAAPKQGDG